MQSSSSSSIAIGAEAVERALAQKKCKTVLLYEDLRVHRITSSKNSSKVYYWNEGEKVGSYSDISPADRVDELFSYYLLHLSSVSAQIELVTKQTRLGSKFAMEVGVAAILN